MGGAASINLLLGMVRVKFAAVLIGTTGVGLIASFASLQGFIGTLAGLGLQSSAVRDIAAAVAKSDDAAVGRAVFTLRRLCWIAGLTGMAFMMLLSPLLSQLTFGHSNYTLDIAALGLIILFANLSGGQMALIQGMRRIGDIARANIYGAAAGTVVAIALYTTLGLRGIIPTLLAVSAIQLALSWYFARQVPVSPARLTWRQTFTEANGMVRLGLVMMWNGLMGSAVVYLTIMLITQHEGTQAVGLYSAAFALSGMFVNFVLGAMGADYYPRLTGVASDKPAMVSIVNEQTEIGLLLALPGLLATMALAPWILQIFYTSEFLGAVELIRWFVLGCLLRVISWPLGFVMLALGRGRIFLFIETALKVLEIAAIALALQYFGIKGVAIAFSTIAAIYLFVSYLTCRNLIGLAWSTSSKKIIAVSLTASSLSFAALHVTEALTGQLIGIAATLLMGVYCLKALADRIGTEHRLYRLLNRFRKHT